MPDHEKYAGVSSDHDGIVRLRELVRQLRQAEAAVQQAAQNLKGAQFREAELAERAIPELMETLGVDDITVDGINYGVDDKLYHSIPKDNRGACIDWLIENGHEASLKDTLSIQFDRGQLEDADALATELADKKLDVGRALKIEPATLSSLLNKRLEAGEHVPFDLFGAYRKRQIKIKKRRKK